MLDIYQSINREALNESFSRFHHLISQKKKVSLRIQPLEMIPSFFMEGFLSIELKKERKNSYS